MTKDTARDEVLRRDVLRSTVIAVTVVVKGAPQTIGIIVDTPEPPVWIEVPVERRFEARLAERGGTIAVRFPPPFHYIEIRHRDRLDVKQWAPIKFAVQALGGVVSEAKADA